MTQCTKPATPAVIVCCELPPYGFATGGRFRLPSHTLEKSRSKEERPAQAIFRQTQTDASRHRRTGRQSALSITVLFERREGFFRQLRVKSFPHFGKEQIKRRKIGASNIQADADRCKQTQMDRLSALST